MKILKLSAENVKRLVAVEITPEGAVITVGGKNGAGKSSVLDSIAYALGGQALVPSEPIRKGEAEAKIEVDLGDLLVIRRFKREHLACDCGVTHPGDMPIVGDDEAHLAKCATNKWGPTKSTLVVKSKDGAMYPSPQAVLDKLIGSLSFDPLAFADAPPKQQLETLRQLTNLDTTLLDGQRKAAFDRRTVLKKQLQENTVKVDMLPAYPKVTETAEISMEEVSDEMLKAEHARSAAIDAQREEHAATVALNNEKNRLDTLKASLEDMEKQVTRQRELVANCEGVYKTRQEQIAKAKKEAERLAKAVPDTEALRARITEIETTNGQIRANLKVAEARAALKAVEAYIAAETKQIEEIDAKKEKLVTSVTFPVEGLGFGENGVTFNGIPFEQASKAEQIRVSVAMGFALNPKLKVLLVRDGSALDSASFKLVAEQALAADAQVWLERVAETKEGVTVMIEDGSVQA